MTSFHCNLHQSPHAMHSYWIVFLTLLDLASYYHAVEGMLLLTHFPTGTDLKVRYQTGRSLLMCEVHSDRKFKLEWFKNGKLLELDGDVVKPPLPHPFADGTGLSLVQWPYFSNFSRGLHECRAANGVDPPVSHAINFQPFKGNDPDGFPKVDEFSVTPPYPKDTWDAYYHGTNITLQCKGSTTKGDLETQWFFNYVPLYKKAAKITYVATYDYWLSKDNSTLLLYNIKMNENHESFYCFIANEVGIRLAGKHIVKTVPRPSTVAPKILPRILVKPKNLSVDAPEKKVGFHCEAIGSPAPEYSWEHNGQMVAIFRETGSISFVALSSGYVTCIAQNQYGRVNATAYLYVRPLPFRAPDIQLLHKSSFSFSFTMQPNKNEKILHPNIPITYAILDLRPWRIGLTDGDPYNQTSIPIKGTPPWRHQFQNLKPWTFIDIRVRFGNRYGVGKPSNWKHGHSEVGLLEGSARNLANVALSNRSFTLCWDPPLVTRGPVQRYELYWTHAPNEVELEHWQQKAIGGDETSYTHDWNGDYLWRELVAPVIYWKVLVFGFLNKGNFSELKAFRVSPGAPGFVTNVSAVSGKRHLHVYWNATKDAGNGIVGHRILYNRKDQPTIEENWGIFNVQGATIYNAIIKNLVPDRLYELKVYPQSHAMLGIPSHTVLCKTLIDAPTGPPTEVKALATSSESIQITWNPPVNDHQNGPIKNFIIFYTKKLNRKPQKEIVGKDARKALLQGLGKYIKYTIWMVVVNAVGEGPPSRSIEIYTNEEAPDGAPRAIRAQVLNETALAVAWLPPLSTFQNGRILGYKIFYDYDSYKLAESIPLKIFEKVMGEDARDGIIRWHHSYQWYSVSVAAFTTIGDGPKSVRAYVETPPKKGIKGPIVTVIEDKTRNFVLLKWWPGNEKVEQYKIEYGKSLRKYDMVTNVKVKIVSPDICTSGFDDLSAGVYYSFKVYSMISEGKGWSAPGTNWVKTSDGIPSGSPLFFEGVTESASSVKLNWEQPDLWKRNGQIISYHIRYKVIGKRDWNKEVYQLRSDEEDAVVYILTRLKSNSRYKIKVRALTRVGSGPDSEVIIVSTNQEVLPTIVQLEALEVEANSTYIQWRGLSSISKFKDRNKIYIINYSASKRFRDEDGMMNELFVNETIKISFVTKYFLSGLTPGTTYTVRVIIFVDEAGFGDPVIVQFTTKTTGPPRIEPPEISPQRDDGSIPVNIKAASEVNGQIHHYLLLMVDISVVLVKPISLVYLKKLGNDAKGRLRRNLDNHANLADQHQQQVSVFHRTALPTMYLIYNDRASGGLIMEEGHRYVLFLRAAVKEGFNHYSHTDSAFSKPFVYEQPKDAVVVKSTKPSSRSRMILIIACSACSVFVIAFVSILLVCRRHPQPGADETKLLGGSGRRSGRSKKFSSDPTEIHRLTFNTPGMMNHPPIHIHNFFQYVEDLKSEGGIEFLKEFESIDEGEKPPSEAATLLQNFTKNRYPNVLAYDHSRVKLEYTGVLCSDYINANYIDGYCKEKAYIATQGPTKSTIDDFWRLCWEQNIHLIVMMTKVEERHRNKCEQYWPKFGIDMYGSVKVELKEERLLCYYCTRIFEVTSNINGEVRIIKHFQYLHWPDPGVPLHAGPVLAFVRRVRSFNPPGCGPTLVHCSAGVGRTACFIAIDAMLERIKHDEFVDIYGYVTMMRSQRSFMVQTDEQYMFVYEVIVEAIESGDTEISSSEFGVELRRLTELQSDGGETLLEKQFKKINQTRGINTDPNLSTINEKKNRDASVIPYDLNRVPLQLLHSHEGSDYINASFIDGCHKKNTFIATQAPIENTTSDFWRMVIEHKSSIVVMLCPKEKAECVQYWPSFKPMRYHYYVIDPVNENCYANFAVREFKITDPRDDTSRKIRQYHYLKWSSGRAPGSTDGMIEFIGQVQKAYKACEDSGPIIVHGRSGVGRTGVYIGLSIALEALRAESVVDMYQIVKGLRYQRPRMIETVEQYEFCYQVIRDYLKSFDIV